MFEALREYGLTENEIALYVMLLKTGGETANRLSATTGIKRSTTYDTLSSLIAKGIVSSSESAGVTTFIAADPQKLVHQLDEKKKHVQELIPTLEHLRNQNTFRTGVSYYEGKKGVHTVLNDILDKQPREFLFIGSRRMAKKALRHYPDNFVNRRAEEGIVVRGVLAQEDRKDDFIHAAKVEALSDFTYLKQLNNCTCNFFVYDNTVSCITNSDDPVGIVIHNAEVADEFRQIFSLLRNISKK